MDINLFINALDYYYKTFQNEVGAKSTKIGGPTPLDFIDYIKNVNKFKQLRLPVLIGVSRKSHLGMILKDELNLETKPVERVEATLAETAIAVQNGADIIRTHDIMQTKKFLAVKYITHGTLAIARKAPILSH